MFGDYTTQQLIELRHLCHSMVARSATVQEAADALLIVQHIDEELARREQAKTA
jgi:hypothetical protein